MTNWETCVQFHGHACGGLTIGYKAACYAAELLAVIRRKGFHYMEALRRAGQSTVGGGLYKGYGEKFLRASRSFAPLAAAQNWEAARVSLDGLEFPRLTTPK